MRFQPVKLRARLLAPVVFTLITAAGFGKVAHPEMIPAQSAYVVSIPDVPAFWKAWKSNALYETYKQVTTSPDVAGQMETFNEQLKTIEAALGFPLDGDNLAQIASAIDIFVTAGETANQNLSGFIITISDREKLEKMVDLAEKAAAQAATADADEATTPTDDATTPALAQSDTATSPVQTIKYKNVEIRVFAANEGREFYYAITDKLFVGANDEEQIKKLIDGAGAADAADNIAAVAEYGVIEKELAGRPGEIYVYTNQKQAMEMHGGNQSVQFLQGFVRQFAPFDFNGASVKINPKEILMYGYAPLSESEEAKSGREWYRKYPGDKPMEVLNYVPSPNLIIFATSLMDTKSISEFVSGIFTMTGGAGEGAADQIKTIETQLGFSFKEDLAPALGNELAFMLNSVTLAGGPIPSVDAALAVRVQDKAKLDRVLQGVENFWSAAAKAKAAQTDAAAAPSGFKTEKVNEATIKYLEIANIPNYSPAYGLDGDYLVIATTRNSVKKMIELKAGKGTSFSASETYEKLQPRVTVNANSFTVVNFSGMWDTISAVTKAIPAAQPMGKVVDALRVLSVYGTSSSLKDNAVVSEAVLLLE